MRHVVATALKVLLAVAGILVLALAGIILFDTFFPSQRVTDFTNVTFTGAGGRTADGAMHHAYLAKPEGAGPHPGVLLIHEFFGLNADIVAKADILAREGYAVLAVDAYGGKTTKQLPRAILFVTTTPQEHISRNVDAGYAYLAGLDGVDPRASARPASASVAPRCCGWARATRTWPHPRSSTATGRSRIRPTSARWARTARCWVSTASRIRASR
jgi:hypothetical protein